MAFVISSVKLFGSLQRLQRIIFQILKRTLVEEAEQQTDSPAKNQICRSNLGFCNFEVMCYGSIAPITGTSQGVLPCSGAEGARWVECSIHSPFLRLIWLVSAAHSPDGSRTEHCL